MVAVNGRRDQTRRMDTRIIYRDDVGIFGAAGWAPYPRMVQARRANTMTPVPSRRHHQGLRSV